MAFPDFLPDEVSQELFAGPKFLGGEPRREWSFFFLLTAPLFSKISLESALFALLDTLPLMYVSGLAEKVTLPSDKFNLELSQFATLQVPFPKGFDLPTFQVQYLEDAWGLVGLFHRMWQLSIGEYFKWADSKSSGAGTVFQELGKVCATAIYSPARRIGYLDVPLPGGADVWPAIFPVDIARDPGNRGGNNLSKVSVTYARVPVWSMKGNIFEWRTGDNKELRDVVSGNWR